MASPIYCELLGAQTRYYQTARNCTRAIEIKNGKVPLFLLHGGGGHAESYARNIVPLSAFCQPIAIDLVWHGLTSKPPFRQGAPRSGQHWLNQFADQVIELMDARGIDRAVVEGQSLGGWIALDLALRYPERVLGIILNTAWGIRFDPAKVHEDVGDAQALLKSSLDGLNNPSVENITKRMQWLMPLGGVTEELIELRRRLWDNPAAKEALTEYYHHLFDPSTDQALMSEADLLKVKCPIAVIWTDRNPLQGPDAGRRIAELVPSAQLTIIENAGHWVQWEKPEEHNEAVRRFVTSL